MRRILTPLAVLTLLVACADNPQRLAATAAKDISEQIGHIDISLIRHPSVDEVRREEFTSIPGLDFSATSLPEETIKKMLDDEKERLISDYIERELQPRVKRFTEKWNNALADFANLDNSQKQAKTTDLDRDLASLETIDSRFQTAVLKDRLGKIRKLNEKIQLLLAGT